MAPVYSTNHQGTEEIKGKNKWLLCAKMNTNLQVHRTAEQKEKKDESIIGQLLKKKKMEIKLLSHEERMLFHMRPKILKAWGTRYKKS